MMLKDWLDQARASDWSSPARIQLAAAMVVADVPAISFGDSVVIVRTGTCHVYPLAGIAECETIEAGSSEVASVRQDLEEIRKAVLIQKSEAVASDWHPEDRVTLGDLVPELN
jgi:hypothetical protein